MKRPNYSYTDAELKGMDPVAFAKEMNEIHRTRAAEYEARGEVYCYSLRSEDPEHYRENGFDAYRAEHVYYGAGLLSLAKDRRDFYLHEERKIHFHLVQRIHSIRDEGERDRLKQDLADRRDRMFGWLPKTTYDIENMTLTEIHEEMDRINDLYANWLSLTGLLP